MKRFFSKRTAIGVGVIAFGTAVFAVGRYARQLGEKIEPVTPDLFVEEPAR